MYKKQEKIVHGKGTPKSITDSAWEGENVDKQFVGRGKQGQIVHGKGKTRTNSSWKGENMEK